MALHDAQGQAAVAGGYSVYLDEVLVGALKKALSPQEHGIAVVGGKGATSRKTPDEIEASAVDISPATRKQLRRTSRLSATVDNGCVQDSYTLYHHTMAISESGAWGVVQQGMGDSMARRYHWLSDEVRSFVEEPQAAICSQERQTNPLDLTADASAETHAVSVDLVQDDPAHLKCELQGQRSLADFGAGASDDEASETANNGRSNRITLTDDPDLTMPSHHELRQTDLSEKALDQLQRASVLQYRDRPSIE